MRVRSLGWENTLEEGMATTPGFLPGKSHGQRSLAGYRQATARWVTESDTTERFSMQAGKSWLTLLCNFQLPWVAQTVKRLLAKWKTRVQSLGREDPLAKEMAIHSSTLAWESHGQRSLIGYSPWGHKESDMTEQLHLLYLLMSWLQSGHHVTSFFHLAGVSVSAKQLTRYGSEYYLYPLRRN